MKLLRIFLSDKVLAWPTFGLVAYLLVLQGLIGNYAQAASLTRDATGWSVICTHLGIADRSDTDRPDPLSHDCCAVACQFATGKLAGGGASAPVFALRSESVSIALENQGEGACPTTRAARLPDARAPPAFS